MKWLMRNIGSEPTLSAKHSDRDLSRDSRCLFPLLCQRVLQECQNETLLVAAKQASKFRLWLAFTQDGRVVFQRLLRDA
jgi:hypothetical protein